MTMLINNKISYAIFGLITIYISLLVTGCNAQSAGNGDSTIAKQKYGNHHFTLDGGHMYYNGRPFMLEDSIQNYAKIFGPYYRQCNSNYVWDSLGMVLMVGGGRGREFENERVVEIKWYLKRTQETSENRDTCCKEILGRSFVYFSVPFHVIPEPLEIKECDVDVIPSDKIGSLNVVADGTKVCFPKRMRYLLIPQETPASLKKCNTLQISPSVTLVKKIFP